MGLQGVACYFVFRDELPSFSSFLEIPPPFLLATDGALQMAFCLFFLPHPSSSLTPSSSSRWPPVFLTYIQNSLFSHRSLLLQPRTLHLRQMDGLPGQEIETRGVGIWSGVISSRSDLFLHFSNHSSWVHSAFPGVGGIPCDSDMSLQMRV